MDFRQRERTQVKRPVAPPVDLNAGRLDVQRAALAGGFVLGTLVVATVGAWLVGLASSGPRPNLLGAFFGLAVVAVSLGVGGVVLYVSITEWLDHRGRVRDWHAVSLAAYEEQGALETVEQVSEIELSTENPAHVLIVALWIHQRLAEGEQTPYTVRKLAGPVFLGGSRAGDLGKMSAERMGQLFAQLGLIAGRGERTAGEWVPGSADEVYRLVVGNWPKVRRGLPYRADVDRNVTEL